MLVFNNFKSLIYSPPDSPAEVIKQRIEHLIEREYLERDGNQVRSNRAASCPARPAAQQFFRLLVSSASSSQKRFAKLRQIRQSSANLRPPLTGISRETALG